MALKDVGTNLVGSLLDQTGSVWTYTRGATSASLTLYFSDGSNTPIVVDKGNGELIEIIMATFRGLVTDFSAFGEPKRGDKITNGTERYEVQPQMDKCSYQVGGMLHIHAKQVA